MGAEGHAAGGGAAEDEKARAKDGHKRPREAEDIPGATSSPSRGSGALEPGAAVEAEDEEDGKKRRKLREDEETVGSAAARMHRRGVAPRW